MSEQSPPDQSAYLSHELLKELRENGRSYLKLDLTYLVAAAATVTTLKINRYELLEVTAGMWGIAVTFLVIFAIDTLFDSILLNEWISAKTGIPKRIRTPVIVGIANWQPALHLFFITGIVAFFLGYAQGHSISKKEYSARADVQEAVNVFISKEKRIPKSLDEVRKSLPQMDYWLAQLENEPVSIEATSKKNYRLVFAGRDKVLGTQDDITVTSEFSLRRFILDMEKGEGSQRSDGK